MKAIVYTKYGAPDVLQFKEIDKPSPNDDEVLVKVYATSVNRTDCATIRARPFFARVVTGLFKPKKQIPGTEFSGIIQAVGKNITSLEAGDKVFGLNDMGAMSHAEYLVIGEYYVLKMPEEFSYEQVAAGMEGLHYAYNFINKVELQEGQQVLVNGATGAIGSAAVQLLKYFGIEVTAVCASENIEVVKSFGVDRIIDYTKDDFTKDNQKFDYVFDTVGKSSFFKCYRLLKPGGIYISSDLGYMAQNIYLPLITSLTKFLHGNKKTVTPFPVKLRESLLLGKKMIEEGKFKPLLDRVYPFEQIVEAYRYVEKGHKKGNVVIKVGAE